MTWNSFHSRGETLRDVVEYVDLHRDGVLPLHLPGVAAHFDGELDLLGALMLKWSARLDGNIERALAREPERLPEAVESAWAETARHLPGIRSAIDHHLDAARSSLRETLHRARSLEHQRLALAGGLASTPGPGAAAAGAQLEIAARELLHEERPVHEERIVRAEPDPAHRTLAERIKAALAA